MDLDLNELVRTLTDILQLANVEIDAKAIRIELLPAPHRRPSRLPLGACAVYAFIFGESCLKVGKAGPKTQARFTSQHCGSNAPSTLAKSIVGDRSRLLARAQPNQRFEIERLDLGLTGGWLEANCTRLHIFLPCSAPPCALSLTEAFIQ